MAVSGGFRRLDLHVHTWWSRDSPQRPGAAVRAAARRLDGLAVTDHNEVIGVSEASEAADALGVEIVPGEEVRTEEGDVIVLGVREWIEPRRPAAEVIDEAREQGAVTVLAHPTDCRRRSSACDEAERLAEMVDAIEILNGRSTPSQNARAAALAKRVGKPGIGGSDAHFTREVGRCWTLVGDGRGEFLGAGCSGRWWVGSLYGALSALVKEARGDRARLTHLLRLARGVLGVGRVEAVVDPADMGVWTIWVEDGRPAGARVVWDGRLRVLEELSRGDVERLLRPEAGPRPIWLLPTTQPDPDWPPELLELPALEVGDETPAGPLRDAVVSSDGRVSHFVVGGGVGRPLPSAEVRVEVLGGRARLLPAGGGG